MSPELEKLLRRMTPMSTGQARAFLHQNEAPSVLDSIGYDVTALDEVGRRALQSGQSSNSPKPKFWPVK